MHWPDFGRTSIETLRSSSAPFGIALSPHSAFTVSTRPFDVTDPRGREHSNNSLAVIEYNRSED